MTSATTISRSSLFAAALAPLAALTASPARADRCDDIAKQLKNQIDGLKVNFKARNIVYLTHPAAKELSLGCRGQNYSLELYAKGDRKPKPEFSRWSARPRAIVFTVPKDDTTTGTTRCLKRMGLLRGDKVSACASAGSAWNARAPRPRPRSRSRAARTSSTRLGREIAPPEKS